MGCGASRTTGTIEDSSINFARSNTFHLEHGFSEKKDNDLVQDYDDEYTFVSCLSMIPTLCMGGVVIGFVFIDPFFVHMMIIPTSKNRAILYICDLFDEYLHACLQSSHFIRVFQPRLAY